MIQNDQGPLWHTLDVDAVLAELSVTRDGLSADEVRRRLDRFGPNRLEVTPPASAWSILVAQFRSVVVLLLVAAAALSIAFGDITDAVAVAAVLVINAALGFVTEFRARRAMDALRGLEVPHAVVVRDGAALEISARDLVPGEVIALEADAASSRASRNRAHGVHGESWRADPAHGDSHRRGRDVA